MKRKKAYSLIAVTLAVLMLLVCLNESISHNNL